MKLRIIIRNIELSDKICFTKTSKIRWELKNDNKISPRFARIRFSFLHVSHTNGFRYQLLKAYSTKFEDHELRHIQLLLL